MGCRATHAAIDCTTVRGASSAIPASTGPVAPFSSSQFQRMRVQPVAARPTVTARRCSTRRNRTAGGRRRFVGVTKALRSEVRAVLCARAMLVRGHRRGRIVDHQQRPVCKDPDSIRIHSATRVSMKAVYILYVLVSFTFARDLNTYARTSRDRALYLYHCTTVRVVQGGSF